MKKAKRKDRWDLVTAAQILEKMGCTILPVTKLIQLRKSKPGIKAWGAIDYLVYHKEFQMAKSEIEEAITIRQMVRRAVKRLLPAKEK